MSALTRTDACCTPSRDTHAAAPRPVEFLPRGREVAGPASHVDEVLVPAGVYDMGDSSGDGYEFDGETPVHPVRLAAFFVDAVPVTNHRFAAFVANTGYVTASERLGYSAVFAAYVRAPREAVLPSTGGPTWWLDVRGADWRHPHGPQSNLEGLDDHPVVHVSYDDARAYADWARRRLPTEAEWEAAARGGRTGSRYPWGDELQPDGEARCNVWAGEFPHAAPDAPFESTSPVRSFPPDDRGVYDMIGNVWEWCADWFDPAYYRSSPVDDPTGPAQGRLRVTRGGSHLCHPSYCNRYRAAARTGAAPTAGSSNLGFRTVRSAEVAL